MRFRSRRVLTTSIGVAILFAIATPAMAAQTSNSEFVIIQEGDVFPEDLYAGAIRVVVDGTLEGDLVAFAAEEVVINGVVTGSVTAISPRLTVNGEVTGSLRVTGNRLDIAGEVGGDVVAAVFSANLTPSSRVGGDVLLWAWNASVLGSIGMDLTGTQRALSLAGTVEGDVDVSVTSLTVVDALTVAGDLGYRSEAVAVGLEMAEVGGAVVDK
jgi:cytoskeletal protein CcmA (bactofilin family)